MLRKHLRERSSLRVDNEVKFEAANMFEYDIPRVRWNVI